MTPRQTAPSLALLCLLGATSCGDACDMPEWPVEGVYTITNPDELPVNVTSVLVADRQLTISYKDELGAEQWVTYQISDN